MLPLGLTFLIHRLLKKNVKIVYIVIALILIGIVGAALGILGV